MKIREGFQHGPVARRGAISTSELR